MKVQITALALMVTGVFAAKNETPDEIAAVLAQKAMTNSAAMTLVADLSTEIGPRLAGSEAEKRAAAWAKLRFEQLGFDKVWSETFPLEHVKGPIRRPFCASKNSPISEACGSASNGHRRRPL
jgi:hypothetical protein